MLRNPSTQPGRKPMKKIALCLAALTLTACRVGEPSPTYSDGFRVGRIEKFSKKGFVFKTWEGRMLLQGYDRDDKGNMVARTFEFSLLPQHEGIATKIEEAMLKGNVVKVHYRQDWMSQRRYDSSYFVDAIEQN